MGKTFQLEIVTPTYIISEGQVEYLRAPSSDGLFGVQAGHASSTIVLDIGEIKVTKNGVESYYATNGGFADIRSESVMLLVETAEKFSDIDRKRVEASLKRAENRMKDKKSNLSRARAAIKRAQNRIKIIDQYNK